MLAEKLHICHSISMPQFRKTHGIPVYLSNVVLAKLQTHHQSWLTCSQPGKPHRQKVLSCSKVHYHHKTVSHWQHWCIHMSQEGIGSICKGPKREQLEATEEDRCLTAEGDFLCESDRCVWTDPKGEAVHLWRWQGATTQENHAEKRSNGSTIFQRTSHENWRNCFHIVSPCYTRERKKTNKTEKLKNGCSESLQRPQLRTRVKK